MHVYQNKFYINKVNIYATIVYRARCVVVQAMESLVSWAGNYQKHVVSSPDHFRDSLLFWNVSASAQTFLFGSQ